MGIGVSKHALEIFCRRNVDSCNNRITRQGLDAEPRLMPELSHAHVSLSVGRAWSSNRKQKSFEQDVVHRSIDGRKESDGKSETWPSQIEESLAMFPSKWICRVEPSGTSDITSDVV